ncbi:MAG: hypothetical protein MUO19_06760 [Dehalococcoidales bacterium]|nr:hypothetical protein [Dehalococcoidales bacterium]
MTEEENEQTETGIIKVEDRNLDESQMSEQLYASAGLDPVVDVGLKDYDETIKRENKLINKVLGPRESDIKGYGEAVAKRVAYAVFAQLNRQYGGKVGDMREYIMSLEDERNRANTRYDELMGRVIGMLGEEYKQLRTDSKEFMEKLNSTLGEDIKASKIDQKALAESLGDIDGLRKQVLTLEQEKQELAEKHYADLAALKEKQETQLAAQKTDHKDEVKELKAELKEERAARTAEVKEFTARIAGLEADVKRLDLEKAALSAELAVLKTAHETLKTSVEELPAAVPYEEIGEKIGGEMYEFVLKDSKVPDAVIKGVGQFIDFKKYLKLAATQAAEAATGKARDNLRTD